jgi:NAD-dependent dihydropyrimidine dehydrogenase PreA subunit
VVSSPFVAIVNLNTCEGCGDCVDRCQMEALELHDNTVTPDVDRVSCYGAQA